MGAKRKSYSPKFRVEAARLVIDFSPARLPDVAQPSTPVVATRGQGLAYLPGEGLWK